MATYKLYLSAAVRKRHQEKAAVLDFFFILFCFLSTQPICYSWHEIELVSVGLGAIFADSTLVVREWKVGCKGGLLLKVRRAEGRGHVKPSLTAAWYWVGI